MHVKRSSSKILFSLSLFFLLTATAFKQLAYREENQKFPETSEQLGQLLFFDKILSSDQTIACVSCHRPEFAFADSVSLSQGVGGKLTKRNTPTAMNVFAGTYFFWDGRVEALEEQAVGPIENPSEMNLPISEAVQRLNKNSFYAKAFRKIFGTKPNRKNLAKALAAFERTLETDDSPFDRYMNGDKAAMSKEALQGKVIFLGKGKCFDCHFGPDFRGDDEFKNIGLYNERELKDKGRYLVTGKNEDLGKFKVPGLRNVALTAPYMHNGMFKTLKEVIQYYNRPDYFVEGSINRDTTLNQSLGLTPEEENDLEEFLKALTDKRFSGK